MRIQNRTALVQACKPNGLRVHIERLDKLAVIVAPSDSGAGTEHSSDRITFRIKAVRLGEASAQPVLIADEAAPVPNYFAPHRFDDGKSF